MRMRHGATIGGIGTVILALALRGDASVQRATGSRSASGRANGALLSASLSGEVLVRELGCAACHADMPALDAARMGAPPLEPATRASDSIFVYLRRQAATTVGRARMPDFHLDQAEALALALFLGRDGRSRELRSAGRRYADADAESGRRIFVALNCAGCHVSSAASRRMTAPLLAGEGSRVTTSWLQSFLRRPHALRPFGAAPGSGSRMPDFRLTAAEADSIAAFLSRRTTPLPAFGPTRLSAFSAAKARSLLQNHLPCLGCHALDGQGGRIGPDLALSGARLRPEYLRAIIGNPQRLVPGSIMPATTAPSATLDLIASYVVGLGSARAAGETARGGYLSLFDSPPIDTRAANDYRTYCAACHGESGRGDGYNARFLRTPPANHTDSAAMAARPDDTIYDAIAAGGRFLDRSVEMPAFGSVLTPDRIRGLVGHVRRLCRCQGPAWSRDGGGP